MTISFRNTLIVFATKHAKSQAAREVFTRILNTTIQELEVDTDLMGTFSGEIERTGSMQDALRGKVRLARNATDSRLILVSEGSFGSAGGFGLAAHGLEMLMLHDSVTGVEIFEQYVSWNTNYATAKLTTIDELASFLKRISFDTHALVLYPDGIPPSQTVYKGILTEGDAISAFSVCKELSPTLSVMAMSDMRAHLNPTRMSAVSACCELLANRLAAECAKCGSGGFGMIATVPGLPCQACGMPTQRARAEKHACAVCGFTAEHPRADGAKEAAPYECEFCNP
jgi:hypothetical protein